MDGITTTVRTIDLGYEQILLLEGALGTRVRVLYGAMWLTEEGAPGDRFAGAGDEIALHAPGRALLEAVGAGRVEVHTPVARNRIARVLAKCTRAITASARRWRAATQLGPVPADPEAMARD